MQWRQRVIDLFFPKFCLGCGKVGDLLCEGCWLRVDFLYEQGCPVCYMPSVGGLTHPMCVKPRRLDGLWCLTRYRGPVKALIRGLKYNQLAVVRELIGQLIAGYLMRESIYLPSAVLVPVPVHSSTLLKRGYNQAMVVAEELGEVLSLPVLVDLVVKSKVNVSQTALGRDQRRSNVRGVFELGIEPTEAKKLLSGQSVIVVDDVFTSGATMAEVAQLLKRSGAGEVWGFALARD